MPEVQILRFAQDERVVSPRASFRVPNDAAPNMMNRFLLAPLAITIAGSAALAQQPRRSRPPTTTAPRRPSPRGPPPRHSARRRSATWLPDDRFWYRVTTADGAAVHPRRSGEGHPRRARSTRRSSPPDSRPRRARRTRRIALPFQTLRVRARWLHPRSRRPRALRLQRRDRPLRRARSMIARRRRCRPPAAGWPWRRAPESMLARRQARRLHQGFQPLGARRRDRPGEAAHDRWREELRLRHGQRRLEAQRSPGPPHGLPTRRRSRPSSRIERGVGDDAPRISNAGASGALFVVPIRCPATAS